MNTKSLMKAKTEDTSQETISSKPKKSIKLADTPPVEVAQTMEASESVTTNKKVIDQIGQLTRNLHDSLRELGYDKRLQAIASEVPEAQESAGAGWVGGVPGAGADRRCASSGPGSAHGEGAVS